MSLFLICLLSSLVLGTEKAVSEHLPYDAQFEESTSAEMARNKGVTFANEEQEYEVSDAPESEETSVSARPKCRYNIGLLWLKTRKTHGQVSMRSFIKTMERTQFYKSVPRSRRRDYRRFLVKLFRTGLSMMPIPRRTLGRHCFTYAATGAFEYYSNGKNGYCDLARRTKLGQGWSLLRTGGCRFRLGSLWFRTRKDSQGRVNIKSFLKTFTTTAFYRNVNRRYRRKYIKFLVSLFRTGLAMMPGQRRNTLGRHCFTYAAKGAFEFYSNGKNGYCSVSSRRSVNEEQEEYEVSDEPQSEETSSNDVAFANEEQEVSEPESEETSVSGNKCRYDTDNLWRRARKNRRGRVGLFSFLMTMRSTPFYKRVPLSRRSDYSRFLRRLFRTGLKMMPGRKRTLGRHCFTYAATGAFEYYSNGKNGYCNRARKRTFGNGWNVRRTYTCRFNLRRLWSKTRKDSQGRVNFSSFLQTFRSTIFFLNIRPRYRRSYNKYLKALFRSGLAMMPGQTRNTLGRHCFTYAAKGAFEFYSNGKNGYCNVKSGRSEDQEESQVGDESEEDM